ncbi:MAG TPA: PIG-L family deacetylase [Thermaerobacter sp.]
MNRDGSRSGEDRPALLVLTAHPDDESFSPGATIARYAAEGVRVVIVCATRGQAGKAGRPPVCSPAELPAVRERELREAARLLGVEEVHVLDYRDGELDRADFGKLVVDLAGWVERVRPDVVMTFPPGGISGHRDHQVLSRAAERAFVEVFGPEPHEARFYYFTLPRAVFERELGFPAPHPLDSAVTTVVDGRRYVDRKQAALQAHRTQHLSVERVFRGFPVEVRERIGWEFYYRVHPALPAGLPPHPAARAAAVEAPAALREAVASAVEWGLFPAAEEAVRPAAPEI